jgi:hypothetical protein
MLIIRYFCTRACQTQTLHRYTSVQISTHERTQARVQDFAYLDRAVRFLSGAGPVTIQHVRFNSAGGRGHLRARTTVTSRNKTRCSACRCMYEKSKGKTTRTASCTHLPSKFSTRDFQANRIEYSLGWGSVDELHQPLLHSHGFGNVKKNNNIGLS